MKKTFLLIITMLIIFANQNVYAENIILADSLSIKFNEKLDLGTNVSIKDIDCSDEHNCLLTVNYGNVGSCLIKTSDGGETWEHILADEFSRSYGEDKTKVNKDYILLQSCFLENNTIISADAFVRNFYKTTDYGQTWDTIPGSIKDTSVFIEDFNMIEANYGYFSTYRYMFSKEYIMALYFTEDGCKSWKRVNIEMNFYEEDKFNPVFSESKIIDNKAFVLFRLMFKNNPIRYKTTIVTVNLETNEQKIIETPQYTNDFYFWSENEGIAVGSMLEPIKFDMDTAIIQKTYDGGKSWELVYKGDKNFKEARKINYYSDDMMAVAGDGNRLLISRDRGEDWEDVADTNDIAAQKYPLSIASEKVIYYSSNRRLYKWVDGETSVVELPKISDFLIYPNPVQDYLLINPPQSPFGKGGSEFTSRGISEIAIYNVLGEKMMTLSPALSQSERELRVDVSHLTTGVYFIKIGDKVEKFVKE